MGVGERKGNWTAVLSSVVLSLLVLGFFVFAFFRWMVPSLELDLAQIHSFCATLAPFVAGVLLLVIGVSLRAGKQKEFDERLQERMRQQSLFALPQEEPVPAAQAQEAAAPAAEAFEEEETAVEEPEAYAAELTAEIQKIAEEEAYVSLLDDNDPIIRMIDAVVLSEADAFPPARDAEAVDQSDFHAYAADELESAGRLGYDISFVRLRGCDPAQAREAAGGAGRLFSMSDGTILCVLPFLTEAEAQKMFERFQADDRRFASRDGRDLDVDAVLAQTDFS